MKCVVLCTHIIWYTLCQVCANALPSIHTHFRWFASTSMSTSTYLHWLHIYVRSFPLTSFHPSSYLLPPIPTYSHLLPYLLPPTSTYSHLLPYLIPPTTSIDFHVLPSAHINFHHPTTLLHPTFTDLHRRPPTSTTFHADFHLYLFASKQQFPPTVYSFHADAHPIFFLFSWSSIYSPTDVHWLPQSCVWFGRWQYMQVVCCFHGGWSSVHGSWLTSKNYVSASTSIDVAGSFHRRTWN